LFTRALGPQPEFYRIATCPKCGYSGYHADFDPGVALPPGLRDQVLKSPKLTLPAGFGPESDPRELDAVDRYALAVTCYRWRGQSDEALAWLHLRASWIAREEGSVLPPDDRLVRMFKYLRRWRPELAADDNQADAELKTASHLTEAMVAGDFNRYQRPYAELALALLLRRHGENRQAAELLRRLADYERFLEPLRKGISRMQSSIEREREQQIQAAEYFERALLAEQITGANRGPACYLLGELFRRLGREREAVRWYDRALADPALPSELQTWAKEQRAVVKP
jgi:tetratricopeptide (TPR) repeat protein